MINSPVVDRFWIVLARLDIGHEFLGRAYQRDLGELPRMREVAVPQAMVWKSGAKERDLVKARAYAAQEGYVVLCYPAHEQHPLEKAKRALLIARPAPRRVGK